MEPSQGKRPRLSQSTAHITPPHTQVPLGLCSLWGPEWKLWEAPPSFFSHCKGYKYFAEMQGGESNCCINQWPFKEPVSAPLTLQCLLPQVEAVWLPLRGWSFPKSGTWHLCVSFLLLTSIFFSATQLIYSELGPLEPLCIMWDRSFPFLTHTVPTAPVVGNSKSGSYKGVCPQASTTTE